MARVDDEALLRSLASGAEVTVAATVIGCSVATVYSRMRDPLFRARLAEMRGKELEGYATQATQAFPSLLGVLHSIATDPSASDKARMGAAAKGIEIGLKLRNEAAVYPRLAALEAALAQAGIDLPPAGVPKEPEPIPPADPDSDGGEAD